MIRRLGCIGFLAAWTILAQPAVFAAPGASAFAEDRWHSLNLGRALRDGEDGSYSPVIRHGRTLGYSGSGSLAGGRLSFDFSETQNRDLLDGRRVLHPWQFEEPANWRRSAGVSLDFPNPTGLSFGLSGGIYHGRRPSVGPNPRLDLGYPARWGETRSADITLDIGVLGDRLRYSGSLARSDFRGTIDYERLGRRLDRWRTRTTTGRGRAHRHRLEADVLTGGPTELSAFAHYETADPSFRPGRGISFLRGELREFGASLENGRYSTAITHRTRFAPGRAQRRITGEFGLGAAGFSLYRDAFTRMSGDGAWRSRETVSGGTASLSLGKLRGSPPDRFRARRLLPSSVRMGLWRGEVAYREAPGAPPDARLGLDLGMSWMWEGALTDASFYRSTTRNAQENLAGADSRDYGLDLSQTFYGETWDVTGYVSVGGYRSGAFGLSSIDRWTLVGVALSYYPERLPDVSFSVDIDRYRGDFPDFEETYGERNLRFDLSLDFSKFMPDGAAMVANYHALNSGNRETGVGRSSSFQHAVSVSFGLPF